MLILNLCKSHFFAASVRAEGDRLDFEYRNLLNYKTPGTETVIEFIGAPTLLDGKIRSIWSDSRSFQNCSICDATPRQMARPRSESKTNFKPKDCEVCRFGFCLLHAKLRSFDWFCKNYFYQDIRNWACPKEKRHLYDARKKELQDNFRSYFGVLVYIPLSGGGNSNTVSFNSFVKKLFKSVNVHLKSRLISNLCKSQISVHLKSLCILDHFSSKIRTYLKSL